MSLFGGLLGYLIPVVIFGVIGVWLLRFPFMAGRAIGGVFGAIVGVVIAAIEIWGVLVAFRVLMSSISVAP